MKYIGLTIGPIYKTLQNAKKTRELWGGSYIFSYIMKQIIFEFRERNFIVPFVKDAKVFEEHLEVGLFHDRFIFESKEGDINRLEKIIAEVLHNLASHMKIDETFLTNYFQINYVEQELTHENPILEISKYLDAKELFYKVSQYHENLLQTKLKNDNSFLIKDAFGSKRKNFPSLPEIALHDMMHEKLKEKINSHDDELSIYADKTFDFKNYHKYIAIVQADGDNMTDVIKSLKTSEEFNQFSKKLFNHCLIAHKLIKEFGGQTIFAGGDDLLFFAPVVNHDKTIFNLCDNITKEFNSLFEGKKTTLSFGINITYHKYPLYEALENTRNLLFEKAKNTQKDNIAFSITKHSGQTFESVLHKGNKTVYESFLTLSSKIKTAEGIDNFLHSLHHKINTHKTTFHHIANDKEKLDNFFDNYFNEDEHKQYKDFFASLASFIFAVYQDSKIIEDDKFKLIYATLRFVKFIKGDKE